MRLPIGEAFLLRWPPVGSGRDDQLAELPHLAGLEVSRLVFERLQLSWNREKFLSIPLQC